jgi:lysozyme
MRRAKTAIAVAVIALATPFIATWEGESNVAYLDTIASPDVWTVCYGETDPKYAFPGAKYTDQQCLDMLRTRVAGFYDRMAKVAKVEEIPISVQAAMLELLYNIGDGQFRSSTILRRANAGDYRGACAELDKWVKAGGKKIKGLVNRRNASEAMCLRDLQ